MKLASLVLFLAFTPLALAADHPPNVILILADDMGYGDLGCYGSKTPTPNLDNLASEGIRFTNFYVAQPICSASRAALMTGCYSTRVSMFGALPPNANKGLNLSEIILPQIFKSRGYATAAFGKWHLGDAPQYLPTHRGFDEYFGLPVSNDMWPGNPSRKFADLRLIENGKTIDVNPDQRQLTTWYTQHAISFIERNKEKPFFLYLPHSMPHVPIHVRDEHNGKTGLGLYSDTIAEIDWSAGEILKTLDRLHLADNTLVIFTSDNGPWLSFGNHAGSAGGLREGKMTTFEGGLREPCIMRRPGVIAPKQVSDQIACTIDFLPTFASMIGAELPKDRIIDGKDLSPLLRGQSRSSPHDAFYYYWNHELQAVRSEQWKLHLPHSYPHVDVPGRDGGPGKITKRQIELSLFDLEKDPAETTNVADQHPDVVARLQSLAEKARDDLGDSLTKREGKNVRPIGTIDGAAATQHAKAN